MSWTRKPLGHGVGLRTRHYGELLERGANGAAWFEVISENYFEPGGRPWAVLDRLRRDVPIVMHGVSLGVGNADGIGDEYLQQLRTAIRRVEPAWVSDHLCWGAVHGSYAHDLWPLPFTEEAIGRTVENVSRTQDAIGRTMLLENVSSYVTFAESTMPEWDFVTEVARRAGCGILLDVNNVFVNAKNHGFDPAQYIDAIPSELVGQLHLAGHTDRGTHLLDSHLGPVPDGVWEVYRKAVARFGSVPTLVEWDEEVPSYDVLLAEAERARAIEREVLGP
jgi:uncharacterized protein (UPF0276 family)